MKNSLTPFLFLLLLTGLAFAQTPTPSPSPGKGLIILGDGDSTTPGDFKLENGIVVSNDGKFSIAIPELPTTIIDIAKDLNGADKFISKQYRWIIGRKVFSVQWMFPNTSAKAPEPILFSDMEIAIRKAVFNTRGTMLSEKPITYGSHRGTEFRSVTHDGVKVIQRAYKIGDCGYQIIGSHLNRFDEKATEDILDSFKVLDK